MQTTQKERKGEKERKSQKKCQKGVESRMVPQVVQNKTFGEGTQRAFNEVTLVWSQKLIQKDAFDLQKMMRKPGRILRILLFSSSGFSDRLWQNDRFCCMICTSF